MGKRQRRRGRGQKAASPPAVTDYSDSEGNVLTLRDSISAATLEQVQARPASAAATADDAEQRRTEILFERLAVRWTIQGLPLEGQAELLGRYRMADGETRAWIARTIDEHLRRKIGR